MKLLLRVAVGVGLLAQKSQGPVEEEPEEHQMIHHHCLVVEGAAGLPTELMRLQASEVVVEQCSVERQRIQACPMRVFRERV